MTVRGTAGGSTAACLLRHRDTTSPTKSVTSTVTAPSPWPRCGRACTAHAKPGPEGCALVGQRGEVEGYRSEDGEEAAAGVAAERDLAALIALVVIGEVPERIEVGHPRGHAQAHPLGGVQLDGRPHVDRGAVEAAAGVGNLRPARVGDPAAAHEGVADA